MNDKKTFNVIFAVALLVLLIANAFLIYRSLTYSQPYALKQDSAVFQQESIKQKIILVSGTGEATAKPSIAVIYLGVRTQAETAEKAQNDNSALMNNVLNTLKRDGITESDIETTSYRLEPVTVYPERDEPPKITGYVCRNNIAVTVGDITKSGRIIDIAVDAGANEVQSIQFKVSDEKAQELYEEALENAIMDADQKASVISESLNVKIIGPLEISVGPSYEPVPAMFEATVKAGTPIMPGELKVTVYVQVSYQYQ
jgi:uncharacterized protein YggE